MRKQHAVTICVLALLALALGACAAARAEAPTNKPEAAPAATAAKSEGFRQIDAADLASMLKHKDFQLVNVHIPYEGEIAGTDALIPYDNITGNLSRPAADKNARIVLYCRSGRMSDIAAQALVQLGYTDVSSLKGGMVAWEQAGNPVLQHPKAEATAARQPAAGETGAGTDLTARGVALPALIYMLGRWHPGQAAPSAR